MPLRQQKSLPKCFVIKRITEMKVIKMYHLNISGDNMWVNYSDETDYELAQGHTRTDLDAL